jgi:class 3 adenylate cyclase
VREVPEIRYARSGDVHIAYQTWGEGPPLVGIPPFVQNIEALWSDPSGLYPRFLRRFGEFATVTHFDKRGTGLSDRVGGFSVEERMEDLRAVMDAVGYERAFVGGISEGGPMAMLFAATYPERTEGLLLYGTFARLLAAPDNPAGAPPEFSKQITDALVEEWGTSDSVLMPLWMPSMIEDEAFCRWLPTYERACASPGAVAEIVDFIGEIDVRAALPAIQCPTIVVHRTGDLVVPVHLGRELAQQISDARYVELAGDDHVPWVGDNGDAVLAEFEEFMTGRRQHHAPAPDRVLATVLFTDIVKSTERAAALGDQAWRRLLDRHDEIVRECLRDEGGREVKTTGDGFLATFDSPSAAVRAATAIRAAAAGANLEIRAGLHTGELERRGEDVSGLAVHVGARVAALAGPSEILVSGTVRDLVLGAPFEFEDRGRRELKGIAGEWPVLAVT